MKLFLLMGSQQEFHWEDAVNSMSLIAINMMLIGFSNNDIWTPNTRCEICCKCQLEDSVY